MNLGTLQETANQFVQHSPLNAVPEDRALRPELAGLRLYDAPILGVCTPADDYLGSLDSSVTGLDFAPPDFWLPGARSVLSLFVPFTQAVRSSNAADKDWPSDEWLHARIEGQEFLSALCAHLRDTLVEAGYDAVVPATDPRLRIAGPAQPGKPRIYGSNWSERHVAYACGLGTFSLSKGLITRVGVAGRLGSLVTTLALPPSGRPYRELYQHCILCGACAANCPAGAISIETGKDHALCDRFLEQVRAAHKPYYGCGKCQVGVPCQQGIPA